MNALEELVGRPGRSFGVHELDRRDAVIDVLAAGDGSQEFLGFRQLVPGGPTQRTGRIRGVDPRDADDR